MQKKIYLKNRLVLIKNQVEKKRDACDNDYRNNRRNLCRNKKTPKKRSLFRLPVATEIGLNGYKQRLKHRKIIL